MLDVYSNDRRLVLVSDLLLLHFRLAGCFFPSDSCANLASILNSVNSHMTELDLSYNKIADRGLKKLCDGLTGQNCKIEDLK